MIPFHTKSLPIDRYFVVWRLVPGTINPDFPRSLRKILIEPTVCIAITIYIHIYTAFVRESGTIERPIRAKICA